MTVKAGRLPGGWMRLGGVRGLAPAEIDPRRRGRLRELHETLARV